MLQQWVDDLPEIEDKPLIIVDDVVDDDVVDDDLVVEDVFDDDVVDDDVAVIESPIETSDIDEIKKEENGLFFKWLVGPTLHLLASALIFYDTKMGSDETCVSGSGGSECTAWILSLGWNGFAAYFIMTWFHELPVGGMNEPDNLFGNWNGMNIFTWFISIGMSGYALYADR